VTRLSVVVPAYNNADFIADTMRSILQQDYEDFEVIVADHSSTDDTVAVLQKFAGDPRVTLLSTPAGGGRVSW
jgi:glycosyltransferase involved in cell wall biosynthesis